MSLRYGKELVFYIASVSEAFKPQDMCYGRERLPAETGMLVGWLAPATTAGLSQSARPHALSAPQSNNISINTLRVNGGSPGKEGWV